MRSPSRAFIDEGEQARGFDVSVQFGTNVVGRNGTGTLAHLAVFMTHPAPHTGPETAIAQRDVSVTIEQQTHCAHLRIGL